MQKNIYHIDSEILHLFRSGEEKGFNFYFREYYAAICYFAFQITKNKPASEEIAGEAFIKLWDRHKSFSNKTSIKSFLYTTSRNISLNWIRQQKSNAQKVKEFAYLTEDYKAQRSPMQIIIEAEMYREIYMALKTLPPKCRKIFRMLYFEGKDYKEIAQELKLSINTIRNQKARALLLIRQQVAISLILVIFFQSLI